MDSRHFDGEIPETLRRLYAAPPFPAEEIEARILATLAARTDAETAHSIWYGTGPAARAAPGADEPGTAVGTSPAARRPFWQRFRRATVAAAALLVAFVAGTELGRRTASPAEAGPAGAQSGSEMVVTESLAYLIQRAGGDYVENLDRLVLEAELSPEERRNVREIATATLRGAAAALLESEEDENLRRVTALLQQEEGVELDPPAGERF